MGDFEIVANDDEHRGWARRIIAEHWGSVIVITRGNVHDTSCLPGFVAVRNGRPVGLVTYRVNQGECELVTLDSLAEGLGIGTALVEAVKSAARASGCRRVWLITTNDNLKALGFYQKRGMTLVAVHRNAIEEARRLKPEIPVVGIDGIPIRDEIELEYLL